MSKDIIKQFLPQVGYYDENTVINADGSVFSMFHVAGSPTDLLSSDTIIRIRDQFNMMMLNVADPNVEIWVHLSRIGHNRATPLPPCKSWFGQRFDSAYMDECLSDTLYHNNLFVTVLRKNSINEGEGLIEYMRRKIGGPASLPMTDRNFLQEFGDNRRKVQSALGRYGCRPLGLRSDNGRWFMEVAEALYMILHGRFRPIGLAEGMTRMGKLICPEELIFGNRAYGIRSDLGNSYGAVLGFGGYPAPVTPIMFDPLLRAPYSLTLTNSFSFTQKAKALNKIKHKERQLKSSDDEAKSQLADLERTKDELQSDVYARGVHHCSVALHGRTMEELDFAAYTATTALANAQITVARESTALKAAFFAQLPGNRRWATRPAGINTRNFASLAALNNVPTGNYHGRWGAPLMTLRTTADTEYFFHWHVAGSLAIPAEDLGSSLLIGPSGSGKTSLLGATILGTERQGARVVVIDKDLGLAPLVNAAGGKYLVIPENSDSGCKPLLTTPDNPAGHSFLRRLFRSLIAGEDNYILTLEEQGRLKQALRLQLRMPPELRSISGVRDMLPHRVRNGARDRLTRWCRGEELGWVFDGEVNAVAFGARMTGFDTTQLLKNTEVAGPMLAYLLHMVHGQIDGTPFLLVIDELWQALGVPSLVALIHDLLKTIRKREGVVVLATQSAHDALKSSIAHTLKQGTPNKIFFGDEAADPADLIDGLGLTPPEFRAVTSTLPLMRHGFLLKRPSQSVICRNDLSGALDKVAVLSGRDVLFDLMNDLKAQYGDDPEQWVPHYERLAPQLSKAPRKQEKAA